MYYYLYKITNKINNKIYIGIHKTKNLDDGYMGSGSYLANAKTTHGIDNFEKQILAFFDSDEELLLAEANIVNNEFLSRDDVYNMVRGGLRCGFEHINERGLNLYGKNGQSGYGLENLANQENGKKLKDILIERGTWEEYKDTLSSAILKLYDNGMTNPFKGRTHSEKSKQQIGQKSSIHQKGSGNSQFGTKWIHNISQKVSRKIPKDTILSDGWSIGRKMKF